jgi:hypothetical protein
MPSALATTTTVAPSVSAVRKACTGQTEEGNKDNYKLGAKINLKNVEKIQ